MIKRYIAAVVAMLVTNVFAQVTAECIGQYSNDCNVKIEAVLNNESISATAGGSVVYWCKEWSHQQNPYCYLTGKFTLVNGEFTLKQLADNNVQIILGKQGLLCYNMFGNMRACQ